MFNFRRLINLYGSKEIYVLKETEGYYDEFNHWVDGEIEEVNIFGAVTRLNTDELMYDEGGTYNADDRKLYCYTKIEKGTKVRHRDKIYTIQHTMDYSEHDKPREDDGLFMYYLKRGDRN